MYGGKKRDRGSKLSFAKFNFGEVRVGGYSRLLNSRVHPSTGADSNVRNRLAHGLCDINEIDDFAHYLCWLAIKMYWCDNEIFQEKGA